MWEAATQRFSSGSGALAALPQVGDRCFFAEQVVDGGRRRLRIETEVKRGVRLRIDIDQADTLAGAGEGGAQVDGRGGFTDAAFLVDDGDAAHEKRGQG